MKLIDLTGQRFGELLVVERSPNDARGCALWACRCTCGVEVRASASNLKAGKSHRCGTACTLGAGRYPWPRAPRYRVGRDGSIVGPQGRILRARLNAAGYPTICYYPDGKARPVGVHIVVCETFHGPCPDGHEVAHEDGNQANPHADNLRWSTHVDNMADKLRHGTALFGETSPSHKLTDDQVLTIRAAHAAGTHPARLAAEHDVTRQNIMYIVRRDTWRHLP